MRVGRRVGTPFRALRVGQARGFKAPRPSAVVAATLAPGESARRWFSKARKRPHRRDDNHGSHVRTRDSRALDHSRGAASDTYVRSRCEHERLRIRIIDRTPDTEFRNTLPCPRPDLRFIGGGHRIAKNDPPQRVWSDGERGSTHRPSQHKSDFLLVAPIRRLAEKPVSGVVFGISKVER